MVSISEVEGETGSNFCHSWVGGVWDDHKARTLLGPKAALCCQEIEDAGMGWKREDGKSINPGK